MHKKSTKDDQLYRCDKTLDMFEPQADPARDYVHSQFSGPKTNVPTTKPLFIPLMKEYFTKFKLGDQNCEIRPNNHRGWNVKNVYPRRLMTLSNGYGKKDRLTREIRNTMVTHDLNQEQLPQWHIDAVENIYGKQTSWLIAYV